MSNAIILSRATVIGGARMLKALGHSGISAFLLELGLENTAAGNGSGLMGRATSIATYAVNNPGLVSPEGIPLQVAIVGKARELLEKGAVNNITEDERNGFVAALAKDGISTSIRQSDRVAAVRMSAPKVMERAAPVYERPNKVSPSRRVFIVHGHDDGAREMVARFLSALGFEAIILHEMANQGRTILEKFEAHSDVGFAVVLLTPDDEGAKQGSETKPRARQNVILEWGYFVGRLGRDRVCALKKGDVELPSDVLGIAWESLDEFGGWKNKLAKELSAAQYEIDWSKVP